MTRWRWPWRRPARETPDVPAFLLAAWANQYGDEREFPLGAYASLARSRGLPLVEVVALAAEGRLAQAVADPVVRKDEA